MHSFTFAASVLATTLFSAASAAPAPGGPPAGPSGLVSTYFGQKGTDIKLLCEDENVDIVPLAFVNNFAQEEGSYCQMDFSNNGWTDDFYVDQNGKKWDKVFNNNRFFVDVIPKCQANGKKVFVSLGGQKTYSDIRLQSTLHAQQIATQLWKMFGPVPEHYTGPRPFGSNVIDGFDLDFEGQTTSSYHADLAKKLKDLFATDSSKQYYLSAAPECPTLEWQAPKGERPVPMLPVLQTGLLDYVFVQFYNNYCGANTYGTKSDEFTKSFNWWSKQLAGYNPNTKLMVGLPGGPGAADYTFSAQQVQNVVGSVYKAPNFGGIMLWDYSLAAANNGFQKVCKKALGGPIVKPTTTTTTTTAKSSTTSSTTTSAYVRPTTTSSTTKSVTTTTSSSAYVHPTTTSSTTKSVTTTSSSSTTKFVTTTTSSSAYVHPTTTSSSTTSASTTTSSSAYVHPTTTSSSTTSASTTTSSSAYVHPTTSSSSTAETTTTTKPYVHDTTTSSSSAADTTTTSKPYVHDTTSTSTSSAYVHPTTSSDEYTSSATHWSDVDISTTSSKPVDPTSSATHWSDVDISTTSSKPVDPTSSATHWSDLDISTTSSKPVDPTSSATHWSDVYISTTSSKPVEPTSSATHWSDVVIPTSKTTSSKPADPTYWSDAPVDPSSTTTPEWTGIKNIKTETETATTYVTAKWSDVPAAPHTRYETVYVDEYVTECGCVEPTSTPVSPDESKPTNSWEDSTPTTVASVPVSDFKPTKPSAPVATFTGAATQQLPATIMSVAACVAVAVVGLLL